jgi:class 3 adenylate cyclase/predicted ATPase
VVQEASQSFGSVGRPFHCSSCNFEHAADRKLCIRCAAALGLRCPKCRCENPPEATFCGDCGTSLSASSETDGSQPSPRPLADPLSLAERPSPASKVQPRVEVPEGERKTVSALFADIKGSTEIMRDLDPEEARAIVDPVLQLMMEAVHRYGGYVAQSTGDGIFALFGAPIAHEDHPQRALHAALAMQEDLRRYAERLRAEGKIPVEARVGVNTGEVVVRTIETGGHTEYTPVGHVTNLAARMQTAAPAGSIATSEATRRLCEGYFEFRALGLTAVKGLNTPIEVYEVVRAGPMRAHFQRSTRRGLTKFVGRERELEQMKHAFEQMLGGHGQVVAVMGEAGTGKSRLFHEFKAMLPAECKSLEAYSVSHGKASAWLPVIELLRDYFDIEDADDAAARRAKVRTIITALDPSLNDALPYLFGLLGIVQDPDPLAQMDPQIKRRRALDAIKLVILRESLNQPLVVIFEDLHWIDAQTQALLDLMVDSVANVPVLLLVNYRPEYRHEWGNKSHYIHLGLNPLGHESAEELLTALLEDTVAVRPLKRLIIEKTGGNPFFIEEIVQALFDEGAVVRNGAVQVTRSLTQLCLPPTVQGILASRIDRLPSEHKQLLQTLAVIGRESPLGLIRQVAFTAQPTQLERILANLQTGEFIYEQPTATEVEYGFKNALTQEVAYSSVLNERRRLLHERIGAALESLYADRLSDHLAELAHHYGESHNVRKAVRYLRRAGAQASQRAANREAAWYFQSALDLIDSLPNRPACAEEELSVLVDLGPALMSTMTSSAPDVQQVYDRARQLADHTDKLAELFASVWGSWIVAFASGDKAATRKLADELFNIAQGKHDPAFFLQAHHAASATAMSSGDLKAAHEHAAAVLALYRKDVHRQHALLYGGHDPAVCSYTQDAIVLQILGYPERALVQLNKGLMLARELEHPPSTVHALWFGAETNFHRRDPRMVMQTVGEWLPMVSVHGSAVGIANAMMLRGWALVVSGQYEAGLAELHDGLGRFRATGSKVYVSYRLGRAAEAFQNGGQTHESLALLSDAFQAIDLDRWYEAELHRLRSELLLMQDASKVQEAERCLRTAIEIAREQSAKSWELRSTITLARLQEKQGRRDEAHAMLAEIYGWFTEGFDTADLKDAKALLEELGAVGLSPRQS